MTDILIIGSGGAGLTAALKAKELGASVVVTGKTYPTHSQTSMAQGGINAALGNRGEDAIDLHIADTIKSAQGLCDEAMVRTMCTQAPQTIAWLESLGVPFSRLDNGGKGTQTIAQRQMGGASAKRACYAQDYTGLKILHTLYDTCLKEQIAFLDEHYLLNLIVEDATVKGATFLDIQTGTLKQVSAKSVIIATGGYGSLYHGYTTNAYGASGDGITAVLRAGGAVSDMEFVQFHPTALKHSGILISESARGEGGYLVNSQGERFIDELKPRDVVARAIFKEFQKGLEVFLDLRHLGEAKLLALLPQEIALCKLHEQVDPACELIPIKPVAHYCMGGIEVDNQLRVSALGGCYAVGECANAKVHGANRLGGNSLLEITTLGAIAAQNAAHYAAQTQVKEADDVQLNQDRRTLEALFTQEHDINFYEQREELGRLLYENVGIIRDNVKLTEAMQAVGIIQSQTTQMGLADKNPANNTHLIDFLEFKNAMMLAPLIIKAALMRDESRGAHFKIGFESANDALFKHSITLTKETEV